MSVVLGPWEPGKPGIFAHGLCISQDYVSDIGINRLILSPEP
jgi:hypothetical protein